MEFVKSIKKLFLSIYGRLKEKVTNAYLILSGRHKIIGDVVVDTTTGEIIGHNSLERIGSAIKNSITDTLCADVVYLKPSGLKAQVIRMLSVLGINTGLAIGIILVAGTKFSYLLLLKVIVLLYLILVIMKFTFYVYSLLGIDRYYYSSIEPLEYESVDNEIASDEEVLAPEGETPTPIEVLAPKEKLEISLLALAIFVAKYSSKGSLVTSDIMYCAFVADPNTLPQGYKMKLKDFYLKHHEELAAISLSIEGEELIPSEQYRSFCKERMFTSDSTYSKARYSNEFYKMVKNQK